MTSPRTCIFTIAAKNYLHFVRALMDSVAVHAPGADRVLALCDKPGGVDFSKEPFRTLSIDDLKLPEQDQFIFQYTLLELSTAIKPFVIEQLFREGYEKVIYFDPDIRVFRSLDDMTALLDTHEVLLTPHITGPLDDGKRPSEREILQCGAYNLGYLGLRHTAQTQKLVAWWKTKMLRDCVVDFARGLFVDQKWMDFTPSLFDHVFVQRDPGWNVAYWNLNHRTVAKTGDGFTVNGRPLTFFHFSGFHPDRGVFSKHQDRYTPDNVPAPVKELMQDYVVALKKHGYPETLKVPCAFGTFPDGTKVPDLARKLYRENRDRFGSDWAAFQKFLNEPQGASPLVTRLGYAVYQSPIDIGLREQFPDVLGVHARGFAEWFVADAAELVGIPDYFIAPVRTALGAGPGPAAAAPASSSSLAKWIYKLSWRWKNVTHLFLPLETRQRIHGWLFKQAYVKATPEQASHAPATPVYPKGLNIVGYLHAELGVGEAARSTIRAAQAAGIPISLIDYRKGSPSRMNEIVSDEIPRGQKYAVNLLHVNADQVPFAVAELDRPFFKDRYNIGFWNWELPDLPADWLEAFEFLDEVWAPSSFCHEAFSRTARKPVTHIPYCIDLDVPAGIGRAQLGLPEDGFLFLFMFDAFSIPERKNPFGLIEAYRRALPSLPKNAKLVLKMINADKETDVLRRVKNLAKETPSIVLLPQYLKRPELNALFNCADCYVSLHRSEGFGLTLAESMFLGKPVIATGWSSNTDFMTPWNSLPVKYKLTTLASDYGPYKKGNTWAEPDLDHAAECMVKVATDADLRRRIGETAKADIREHFSPAAVGAQIRKRLDALGLA